MLRRASPALSVAERRPTRGDELALSSRDEVEPAVLSLSGCVISCGDPASTRDNAASSDER